MKYQITAANAGELRAILCVLAMEGYRNNTYSMDENPVVFMKEYLGGSVTYAGEFKVWPVVTIDTVEKEISGNKVDSKWGTELSFSQFLDMDWGLKVAEVRLNEKHVAIVTKDGITVGCQTFPLSVVDKLVEARDLLTQ